VLQLFLHIFANDFSFGESALIVAATIWLIFIILLIVGLRQNRPNLILAHLISCVCSYQFGSTLIHFAVGSHYSNDRTSSGSNFA
jgi:hypothetical protein